ncbi:23S rRNA (guanosine(2251)-2'-O)-methyltransferase RlmB [Wenzhouxiangella sp. AB-CW3]|uniref:23S rRNA (guanosine(2251)-2'-O)-methyltransferase RlmB n=1 Tax=Wenzhouxiangella sp. AB-CW3 TaxID=2771012 RepID=UPI00168AD1CE|nr:23S rRNA (guanosine(2251)-2'-O)-methyltransferase RlmB [Wenzhouxiangella sp. AB-CW3]QOC23965.1 23S rRNA (guanosine(2251)-2'-O)-methyltransferase RlmB [Wenzhouxiangella sp. AB-CW3]
MKRELAMGINAVEGLVRHAPERIVRVWIRPGNRRLEMLEAQLRECGVSIEPADQQRLDRKAGRVPHQGVIAEFQPLPPIDEASLKDVVRARGENTLLLILDGVQDPHNLGACLRSAAAAGADAVVVPRDRAAGMSPAARRVAAGGAEQVPVAVVTNLARTMRMLADHGVWLVGLAGEATDTLYHAPLSGPVGLVLGSEDRGLRQLTRKHCDALVRIPMPGEMESLNVSVSAGIALFEVVRRRSQ